MFCRVVLYDKMSTNLGILYFQYGIIVNTYNSITYNGGSHEFLTATLDIYDIFRMLCARLDWNMFEIKVEITWRMLQTGVSQACYFGVPICSNKSVNSMFGFAMINEINMLELYLNNRSR